MIYNNIFFIRNVYIRRYIQCDKGNVNDKKRK